MLHKIDKVTVRGSRMFSRVRLRLLVQTQLHCNTNMTARQMIEVGIYDMDFFRPIPTDNYLLLMADTDKITDIEHFSFPSCFYYLLYPLGCL